jgi:hypothetical protein
MGEVSFIKWNSRPDMAKDVKGQLATKSPCIKVIHPPRKNAKRKFYSLIPRQVIETYLKKRGTLPFKNQVGNLITDNNLQTEWRAARKRAGFIGEPGEPNPWKGVGCHEIRDTWFTYAQTQGCAWDVAQFTIGHTQFSEQGYNKVWANEKHVWEETCKVNFATQQASKEELDESKREIKELKARLLQVELGQAKLDLVGYQTEAEDTEYNEPARRKEAAELAKGKQEEIVKLENEIKKLKQ